MEQLHLPLNDVEEAVLALMKQVQRLEEENRTLRQEIKQLKWSLEEHD